MTDTALKATNIAQVSIKNSETDYGVISLHQFLSKGVIERTTLVTSKRVEFIDFEGNKIPLLEGLRAITALIRQSRAEGTFSINLSA